VPRSVRSLFVLPRPRVARSRWRLIPRRLHKRASALRPGPKDKPHSVGAHSEDSAGVPTPTGTMVRFDGRAFASPDSSRCGQLASIVQAMSSVVTTAAVNALAVIMGSGLSLALARNADQGCGVAAVAAGAEGKPLRTRRVVGSGMVRPFGVARRCVNVLPGLRCAGFSATRATPAFVLPRVSTLRGRIPRTPGRQEARARAARRLPNGPPRAGTSSKDASEASASASRSTAARSGR
jgi:hypothetical protein